MPFSPNTTEVRIKVVTYFQVENRSGKYVSQKTATFQDLALLIRTGFVSQDEKDKTKPQREIICKGNKIMDFPDMSSLTQARRSFVVLFKVFKVALLQRKMKLGNYPPK